MEIKKKDLDELILSKRNILSDFDQGVHGVRIDNKGNVNIDGLKIGVRQIYPSKYFGNQNEFKVDINGFGLIEIKRDTIKIGEEEIQVSTKKHIIQRKNGKYYKKIFFNSILYYFKIEMREQKYIRAKYVSSIPKKSFVRIQPIEIQVYANEIPLNSYKRNHVVSEGKFVKRIGNVIVKTVTGIGSIFYISLRVYEKSLLP
jgi:hypothetical protein